MISCLTDEILDMLVVTAHYDEAADVLCEWYGGLVDGIAVPMPRDPADDATVAKIIEELRQRL